MNRGIPHMLQSSCTQANALKQMAQYAFYYKIITNYYVPVIDM